MSQKPKEKIIVPHETIAEMVGCSASLVAKIRLGQRPVKSEIAEKIAYTDQLLQYGSNKLVQEVERLVKFK